MIIAIHSIRGQSRNARRRSLRVMRAEQALMRLPEDAETDVQVLGDALWKARAEAGIRPKSWRRDWHSGANDEKMRDEKIYMAVVNEAEHDGRVVEVDGPAWPEPGGWTYQGITGAHGSVLAEGADFDEVNARLDAWLDACPGKRPGGRCYTHGPHN